MASFFDRFATDGWKERWLFLISTPSNRPMRWFIPPPQERRTCRECGGRERSCECRRCEREFPRCVRHTGASASRCRTCAGAGSAKHAPRPGSTAPSHESRPVRRRWKRSRRRRRRSEFEGWVGEAHKISNNRNAGDDQRLLGGVASRRAGARGKVARDVRSPEPMSSRSAASNVS